MVDLGRFEGTYLTACNYIFSVPNIHPITFNEAEHIVLVLTVDSRAIVRISHDLSCRW